MNELSQRVNNLPHDKIGLLMQKLRPGMALQSQPVTAPVKSGKRAFRPSVDGNYRLQIAKPGLFNTLGVSVCPRETPGPGCVEIEVHATGLNFRDVMVALGSYPIAPGASQPPIGVDCAGIIASVGPDCGTARVGDEVMCMGVGTFTRYLTAHHSCLMPKPPGCTFEQAAALPCVFETVQYSMVEVAQLRKGESVLIHSAAGGVGLAAIQVANTIGAEIFATVGTPEKREMLEGMGIRNIFDSRSTSFADDIIKVTGGQGVDVILNSLAGEAIPKGFGILRPWGRFLELGKRDLASNAPLGMFPFLRGCSFTGIDLGILAADKRPDIAARVRGEITRLFREGAYKPLPVHTYSLSDAAVAFGYMMQGKHTGKLVFTFSPFEPVMSNPS